MQVIDKYTTEVILYSSIEEYVKDADRRIKEGYLEITKVLNTDSTITGVFAINRTTINIRSYLILHPTNKMLVIRENKRIIYQGKAIDLLNSERLDNKRLKERIFQFISEDEDKIEMTLV